MISVYHVKQFCSEPIENIENYCFAINDKTRSWHCHHRKETDLNMTKQQLIDLDLYYGVPASDLIFLTHEEHSRIHLTGKEGYFKGKETWMKGKKHTEESKKKMSESHKGKWIGKNNPNFGKDFSGKNNPSYKKICPIELFCLREIEHKTWAKIGEILNISSPTVKNRWVEFNLDKLKIEE